MITRYSMGKGVNGVISNERQDGTWVRYDDHIAVLKNIQFGLCIRCKGTGIDLDNGTDTNPEPDCERCCVTGDEGNAPAISKMEIE